LRFLPAPNDKGAVMLKYAVFLAGLLSATAARADWLDRAWQEDVVNETGGPAVTLSADGVILVLPDSALNEAHAAGVSTRDAVRLFIERHGQHCSDIIDLDEPQRNLKVQLFVSRPVALEDASERVQGEVLNALKEAKQRKFPRVKSLFVTADEHTDLVIDYVPTRRATCVQPGAKVS
jgi:hypothetical protein